MKGIRASPTKYLSQLALRIKKVKQSHYRPGQAVMAAGCWGSQISRQSTGKVSPMHRPPLPQEIFLVLISIRGWVDPRPLRGQKDYVNEKFQWHNRNRTRLVAQCLNQLRHRAPLALQTGISKTLDLKLRPCKIRAYNKLDPRLGGNGPVLHWVLRINR